MHCCSPTRRLCQLGLGLTLLVVCSTSLAGEPERLTRDGRLKFSPVFLPGGQELVYAELVDPTLYQLRRLGLAGGESKPLHASAPASEFEPAWSADGACYAYLRLRGVLSISIVVRDQSGTQLSEILPGEGFCGYRSPAFAPDHSRLAFSYAEGGTQQIYSTAPSGDDRKALTDSRGLSNWPAYSPDGRSIVFGSSRDGNFEIYVMNADGSDQRRLTDSPFQDSRPRFSPDGRRIAFTSHRDGNAEIYVMNADGSAQLRVTQSPERDDYAEWRPGGEQLVIVSERQGRHDLYLVGAPR